MRTLLAAGRERMVAWASVSLLLSCVLVGASQDLYSVTWSHATNSRWKLDRALNDERRPYLEADVSLADGLAVMAHPPVRSWDLSLKEFLRLVCSKPKNVTLKLDFKSNQVLDPSFVDMEDAPLKNLRDLWLNADVLQGAGGPPLVDAQQFLRMCASRFPKAVLSLGWTTVPLAAYSWSNVEAMARLLLCGPHPSPRATFPVRVSMLAFSIPQLVWLLEVVPNSTLTVWASASDPWDTDALVKLRQVLPWSTVYYDLPDHQKAAFEQAKKTVTYDPMTLGRPTWSLTIGTSCNQSTLAGSRAVVFRGSGASVKLPVKWEAIEGRLDLTKSDSVTLSLGTNKVTLEGQCFYLALTKKGNVTARFWTASCYTDSVPSTETPVMTREWSAAMDEPVLHLESPGSAVFHGVHVTTSASPNCLGSSALTVVAFVLAIAMS